MDRRITIDDVAAAAGVSKQTVSRAVNDKGEIDPATKERIMNLVRDMGYRPNRLANAFHTQRTRMVGFVIPDIANPFFAEVARGVQRAAMAHAHHVLFCNTDENPKAIIQVMEQLASQGVDGIITFTTDAIAEKLLRFADSFRPIVVINREVKHPNIQLLIADHVRGAQLAVEHFLSQGLTEVGMLANQYPVPTRTRRVMGFQKTLLKAGLKKQSKRVIGGVPTLNGGYEATTKLLTAFPKTNAIFTYNDLMAFGAIRACHDLKRRVPQDVSIIGFDDIRLASMYLPSLSTIRVDKEVMGQLALQRIVDVIEHPETKYPTITMEMELVLRESTRNGRA